jgi:hypothetical protein
MILSFLIVIASLTIFFVLKERFDERPRAFRVVVSAVLTLTIGTVLTMELFIYIHARIVEFKEAVSGVPAVLVVVVFLGLLYAAWWLLMVLGGFNREQFRQFVQDTFVPRAKETFREVAETGRVGWQGLKLSFRNPFRRRRAPRNEDTSADEQDEPPG